MKVLSTLTLLIIGLVAASAPGLHAEDSGKAPAPNAADREKQFSERLSRSRMIGFYSVIGQEGPPKQDEYTLGAVEKKDGDTWQFEANIQFGKSTMNVPLQIPVLWAGDTPVISVTNFSIPGLGTYTARVLFHGDQYAGTWSSDKHGGYLWGRLEKIPEGKQSDSPPTGQQK